MRRLAVVVLLMACADDGSGGDPTDAGGDAEGDAAGPGGSWETRAAIGEGPRQEHAVVAAGGKVYVIGGFDGGGTVSALVEAYDPASNTWETRAPLPSQMHHLNVTEHGGKIYVMGGLRGGFNATSESYVYDPGTNQWSPLENLPIGTERGAGVAVALDDLIVVAGGLRGGQAVTDVTVYDTEVGDWAIGVDLPEPLDHLGGGVVGDTFYVAGGRDATPTAIRGSTYEYAGAAGWIERAPMITARGGVASAVHDGALYVFGGEGADNANAVFPEVERYIPSDNVWESLTPMPTPRHGMGAATVDGVIYVPGGGDVILFGQVAIHEAFTPPDRD